MNIKNKNQLKKIIPLISYNLSDNVIIVSNQQLSFSLTCLKLHFGYQYSLLSCISGVDFLSKKYRFGVVYDFLSLTYNVRLRLKVFVNEVTPVNSIVDLYINANWWEREIWDLYGVYFDKHPDLRRILTDYGFENHPMRKDFPCSGFVELRYNETKKKIVVRPIHLAQEFRLFNFQTPW
jgi:NADH dehydrogenase (ubiquinone) Fe-S protein 3